MKMNKLLCTLLAATFLYSQGAEAQDPLPKHAVEDTIIKNSRQLRVYDMKPDTISVRVIFPDAFTGTGNNRIVDTSGALIPVLEHLRLLSAGVSEDSLRVVHIGDSHVRGHIFPRTTGARLAEVFGAVVYTDMGVNGATSLTFTHPERIEAIAELHPELLVLSFGTNESHNRKYNATVHYHQIDELVKLLQQRMPGIPILLTTPPGSYESFRQRRRARTYSINPRTATAADAINRYAGKKNLASWDMYDVVGGSERACKNWEAAGLMRPDHVHYLPEGYVLQGDLLFEAIINAYNDYVLY